MLKTFCWMLGHNHKQLKSLMFSFRFGNLFLIFNISFTGQDVSLYCAVWGAALCMGFLWRNTVLNSPISSRLISLLIKGVHGIQKLVCSCSVMKALYSNVTLWVHVPKSYFGPVMPIMLSLRFCTLILRCRHMYSTVYCTFTVYSNSSLWLFCVIHLQRLCKLPSASL